MAKYKNVTGSVQEKNGSWHAVLNYTDLETGKRKNKWKKIGRVSIKRGDGGLTEKQAKEALPKFIVELEDVLSRKKEEFSVYDGMSETERRIYKEQNTDFYEYAGKFLEQKKGSIHISSYISYESQNNSRIKDFFHNKYKLKDISYFVLEEFFNKFDEDGLKRTTKTRYKAFLKLILDDAVTKGLLQNNPIYQFPKGTFGQSNFKAETFKITEIQEFLSKLRYSDDIIAKLVIIASHFALRREEILGWKWSQIDFNEKKISLKTSIIDISPKLDKKDILKRYDSINEIYITDGKRHVVEQNVLKTQESASVMPLSDYIIDILKEIKEETDNNREMFGNCYDDRFDDYVFVRPDGFIITPTFLSNHFPILLKKYNMKRIRFHDLRHTTATLLLKDGWSVKHVQEWLRHSDAQTTAKFYLHTDDEELIKVGTSIESMYGGTGTIRSKA